MRRIMALLALTGLAGGLAAELTSAQAQPTPVRRMRGPADPPPPSFTGERTQVALTFEQNIPVVEISLNGRGPYRFAIDTGAVGHGRIRPAVAEALGLEVVGEMQAGDGSGRTQVRRRFEASTLAIGGVTFSEVALSEMPALPGRLDNVDGILGFHLFASHLLTLDYAGARLILSRDTLPDSAPRYESGRAPVIVPVTIGDLPLPTTVDTGNSVALLIVPASIVDRLPRSGEPRRAGTARTSVSTIEMWEMPLSLPVRMGNVVLPIDRVRYPALDETGNLGSIALRSGILRIDQRNRRIEISFASGGERG